MVKGTSGGSPSYVYGYDYRTRRILRDESGTSGGVSTHVVFSGGTSVQELDGSNTTPTVEYIRGSDYGGGVGGLLYSLRGGTPSFNHYNTRGDVVAKTDNNGALTYQACYEGYGTRRVDFSPLSGLPPDRQKANTKDEDPTGLLNEGMRYRDLATGTFITRDPAGFVDGPNLYTYVQQNPWTKFDPEGLTAWDRVEGYAQGVTNYFVHTANSLITLYASGLSEEDPEPPTSAGPIPPANNIGNATDKNDFANGELGGTVMGAGGTAAVGGVGLTTEKIAVTATTEETTAIADTATAINAENKGATAATTPTQSAASTTSQASADAATQEAAQAPKGSNNPNTAAAANRGSSLHSDKPGNLPDQLRNQYPDTKFKVTKPGEKGQDVQVTGGTHPSDYPGSKWAAGKDHGDFKPDTAGGRKTFNQDQKNKWSQPTQMIPYNSKTGKLTN